MENELKLLIMYFANFTIQRVPLISNLDIIELLTAARSNNGFRFNFAIKRDGFIV